jgi:hypothetical protein
MADCERGFFSGIQGIENFYNGSQGIASKKFGSRLGYNLFNF